MRQEKKKCAFCKEVYASPREHFHKDKNQRDKLNVECKYCIQKRQRGYYKNNKAIRDYQYNYTKNKRNERKGIRKGYSDEDFSFVLDFFNNRCAYCNISVEESLKKYNRKLSRDRLDHNKPYDRSNVICVCVS